MTTHGLTLVFDSAQALVRALRLLKENGFEKLEAYSPHPIDEVSELLQHGSRLPLLALIGGVLGGGGGYYLQHYTAVRQYPVNVGGRPLESWPAFIPVTFELTILGAGIMIFIGFFIFSKLPQPYHPIFSSPQSERISNDRFVICLDVRDPLFLSTRLKALLPELRALEVGDAKE